jgi:UDP-N-acetylmuramoylalanine-D-glutamate ligase
MKERLDTVERTKLRKLEATVAEGIASFVVVGEALKEIRDAKLYRESHKTFEKYVDDKWGLERRRAYQLIEASDAKANLSKILHNNETAVSINTESQLRELKDVPADSMEAVVNKAADIAGDDTITASDIKQAREEVLGEATATTAAPTQDTWQDVKGNDDDSRMPEFKSLWHKCNELSKRAIWVWLCDNYEGSK